MAEAYSETAAAILTYAYPRVSYDLETEEIFRYADGSRR